MPPQPDTIPLAASPRDLLVPVAAPRRKPGKHAAPTVRPQLLPGLLLVSAGAAFAGLAAMPSHTASGPGSRTATTGVIALGGPNAFSDLRVSLKPPLPQPVVKAKIRAAKDAKSGVTTGLTATRETAKTASLMTAGSSRASRSAARTVISSDGYARPCDAVLTSGFGYRWGALHAGLDFGAPTGTPIHAVQAGVVKEIKTVSNSGGYGNLTILQHADGTITYYAHQSKIMVTEGQVVATGEVIGLVGSTGHSTGPHLHFEVHPNGGPAVDPRPWLAARGIF